MRRPRVQIALCHLGKSQLRPLQSRRDAQRLTELVFHAYSSASACVAFLGSEPAGGTGGY